MFFSLMPEPHVPGLLHLIALKLHAMKNNPAREARDLSDVTELIRQNSGNIVAEEIEAICNRYATTGITAKVMGCLR